MKRQSCVVVVCRRWSCWPGTTGGRVAGAALGVQEAAANRRAFPICPRAQPHDGPTTCWQPLCRCFEQMTPSTAHVSRSSAAHVPLLPKRMTADERRRDGDGDGGCWRQKNATRIIISGKNNPLRIFVFTKMDSVFSCTASPPPECPLRQSQPAARAMPSPPGPFEKSDLGLPLTNTGPARHSP